MADTLQDALSALNGSTYSQQNKLIINSDLRTITVPKNFIFGVYNDKDVLSVDFEMPRYYDDIDLSEFKIQVNYINAAEVGDYYSVVDPVIGEDKIEFEWILGRGVFALEGIVKFIVCMRKLADTEGNIDKEFNTTIATGTVLAGIEVDSPIDPEAYSILSHMKVLEDSCLYSANRAAATADAIESIAEDCEAATQEARSATAAATAIVEGLVPITSEEIDNLFT